MIVLRSLSSLPQNAIGMVSIAAGIHSAAVMKSTKVQTLGSKCARLLFCKLGGLGRASSEGACCRLTQVRLHLSG